MSRVLPTRQQLRAKIRQRLSDGEDPATLWLTITEVGILVDFHRRTLQRFVDERTLPSVRRGPTKQYAISYLEVRKMFPQDTRAI
jgi:hypothetical protein